MRLKLLQLALGELAILVSGILGVLALIEVSGQLLASLRPTYDAVFLEPDEKLGWKQMPGLSWVWAGGHWYAADFSVPIETNSQGFRDLDLGRSATEGAKGSRKGCRHESGKRHVRNQIPFTPEMLNARHALLAFLAR